MTGTVGASADRCRRLRAARIPGVALGAAVAALLLSGCSDSGSALAQAACAHVDTSIHLYTQAERAKTTAAARAKADRAANQLNQALQFAAQANSANPAFNPLMTTLQEIGRTSEANLIPALRAQCTAAEGTSQSPTPGSTPSTPFGGGTG